LHPKGFPVIKKQYDTVNMAAPETPLQALIVADAHVRAMGLAHLSPLDAVLAASSGKEVAAGLFTSGRLTLKELLPGLKLRAGSSELEIVRVRPTEREVTYKTKGKFIKMDSQRFLTLANQQGYRKIWDLKSFLLTLKTLLMPVLASVPLMWVLKLVTNAVRRKPVKFESTIPKVEDDRKLSSPARPNHHDEHKKRS
jgi:hypothetical protein